MKKARATEKDTSTEIIMDVAKKTLLDIQQRCSESLKALEQRDFLVVIGALAGLEEQIQFVIVRLMVLREIKEYKTKATNKQKIRQRRKYDR